MQHRKPDIRTPLLALLGFALVHCIFDDRTAGTSTTITNPLTGVAILLDGKPAAGARVHLRTAEYELTPAGAPFAKVAASTTVDDTGGFTLPMPSLRLREHYLAFQQVPKAGDTLPVDSIEVQLRRWPDGMPHSGLMGSFRLGKPGGLSGLLASGDTTGDSTRWIGDRGTDNFTTVAKDGAFKLAGMAPGLHHLVVITVPVAAPLPASPLKFSVRDFVAADTVKSGEVKDVGKVVFNDS